MVPDWPGKIPACRAFKNSHNRSPCFLTQQIWFQPQITKGNNNHCTCHLDPGTAHNHAKRDRLCIGVLCLHIHALQGGFERMVPGCWHACNCFVPGHNGNFFVCCCHCPYRHHDNCQGCHRQISIEAFPVPSLFCAGHDILPKIG